MWASVRRAQAGLRPLGWCSRGAGWAVQGQESADLWGWLSVSPRGRGTRHLDCLAPLPLRLREGRWSGRSGDEQAALVRRKGASAGR